ncbi:TetR/AcrR family transcriptional regulator [Periweissella cryptocerci]|nr:TetR/AcrR family transcriptional regulator [Periweissella cryptocerci]
MTNKQVRTRRDIIQALRELLNTTPFENITTKQICTTALVHHSTFYRYFTDKYDLLSALITELCAQFDGKMSEATAMAERISLIVQSNRVIFKNITASHAMYYELIQIISKLLRESAQNTPAANDDILIKLIKNSPHPEIASYSFAGMLVGVLVKWTEDPSTAQPARLKQFIEDVLNDLSNLA